MTQRFSTVAMLLLLVPVSFVSAAVAQPSGHALFVGVDHYDHFSGLSQAGRDAEVLGRVFQGEFGLRTTVLTTSRGKEDPRRAPDIRRVRFELRRLIDEARPEETIIFGFSGHGHQEPGKKDIYLALADTEFEDQESRLTLNELYKAFARCKAKQKLLILDACRRVRTGDRAKLSRPEVTEVKVKVQIPPPPPGVVVLLSCAPDEVSVETSILGHGVFTYFLLTELRRVANEGSSITTTALAKAVVPPVVEMTTHRMGKAQTPQQLTTGKAEVTLRVPAGASLRAGLKATRAMNWKAAEASFTAGLEQIPDSPRLLAERSVVRSYRGNRQGASEDAKMALFLAPDFPPALRALALSYLYNGELSTARKAVDRAIWLDPRYAGAYITRSKIASWQGELSRSLDDAKQAVRLDSAWPKAVLRRADAHSSFHLQALAAADAREVLRRVPNCSEALLLVARSTRIRIGRIEEEKLLQQALDAADNVLAGDPGQFLAVCSRISALRELRNYDEAQRTAKAALTADPSRWDMHFYSGKVLFDAKQHELAEQAFTTAVQLGPEFAAPFLYRGEARRERFDREGAAADFRTAVRLAPDAPTPRWGLAYFLHRDDPEAALAECDVVLSRYPNLWPAYAIRARMYRTSGDPDRCLADLATAAQLAPSDPLPLTQRGEVLQALGRLNEAVTQFHQAIKLAPKSPNVYTSRGWAHLAQGDREKAEADFRTAISLDPTEGEFYTPLGVVLFKLGRYEEVVEVLSKAVELGVTDDSSVYFCRGIASMLLGDLNGVDFVKQAALSDPEREGMSGRDILSLLYHSAETTETAMFDQLVEGDPDNFLFYFLRSRVHRNAKRYSDSRRDADAIATLHPKSPLPHVLRAETYAQEGKFTKVIQEYDRAIKLAPRRGDFYRIRAQAHVKLDQLGLGKADVLKAIELNPDDAVSLYFLGNFHMRAEEWKKAEAVISKAIENDSQKPRFLRARAECRFWQENLRGAEEDHSTLIELEPEEPNGYVARAWIRERLGDAKGVAADLTRATELNPASADANRWYSLGNAHFALDKKELAVEDFTRAIKLAPEEPILWGYRGTVHLTLKQFNQAATDFRKARELDPEDEEWIAGLADTLAERGRAAVAKEEPDKAIKDFNEALELSPNRFDVLMDRGDLLWARKELDLAARDFDAAVRLTKGLNPFALARRALLAAERGNDKAAVTDFDHLYQLGGIDGSVKGSVVEVLVAAVYYGQEGDLDNELVALDRILKAHPGLGYLHWRRGMVYGNQGRFDDAIIEFTTALNSKFERPALLTGRALSYSERGNEGDFVLALADAEQAIKLDKKWLPGHQEKALALLKLGQFDEAMKAADVGLALDPADGLCFSARMEAQGGKGDWKGVERQLLRAIEKSDVSPVVLHSLLGLARLKQEKFAGAESTLSEAIELDGYHFSNLNNRGLSRVHLGKLDEAISDFIEAHYLNRQSAEPHKNLGLAYLKQKNYGFALDRLNQAIELAADFAEAYRLRAEVYRLIGEPAKAEVDQKKADELDPGENRE